MRQNAKELKYLWIYSAADDWTLNWHSKLIDRRKKMGYDVEGFCITPVSLNRRWLPFESLDKRWKQGEKFLMDLYKELAVKLENKDALILYNGANLHPDFVKTLSVLKIYTAGDDPESTEILTKPVAPAFDIHLINNIACLDMYKSWGLKRVHFWPLGSLSAIDEIDLDENKVADISMRTLPAVFFGEYQSAKKERLKKLSQAFPRGYFAGRGWEHGYTSWDAMWNTYLKSQIGWNLHNSTGPINFRTYELPAYGVLQLCDNKSDLAGIYQLNKEVVGFDSIDECIELTNYYLAHKNEQREIAVAGWKRWKQDYHPDRVWERLIEIVDLYLPEFSSISKYDKKIVLDNLKEHESGTFLLRSFKNMSQTLKKRIKQIISHNE